MELSVIVCVYNTKKHLLEKCLSSIRHSTLNGDYEILLIDDGSGLDYSDIVKKYGVRYTKTVNRGHLGARLLGISEAVGDYVAFVDSDDTVSLNYHRPMLDVAKMQGADIVINGWAFHTERTKRVCVADSAMATRIRADGDDALLLYTASCGREHSYFVLWNKLYRRTLLREMKECLEALEIAHMRMTYSEDALMNFFIFRNAKKVINLNSGFYFYKIHDSQSITVTGKDKLREQIVSMSFSLGIMKDNIGKNKYADGIRKNLEGWSSLMARTHFSHARALGAAELFPYIKAKYGIRKNRVSYHSDGAVYSKCELLGDNFDEIDEALTKIYFCGRESTATYERESSCISRIIENMPHAVTYSKKGEFFVPRRRVKPRDRVLHNPTLYRMGTALFKKGSRIRAFLKKHL